MNSWTKLRNTFQGKNRDLDAEFEQFLNESLSEESVSSPRNAKTPRSKKKLTGSEENAGVASGSRPWWESSVDDESSKDYNTAAQNWFKKTTTVKEEDEILEEHEKTNKETVQKELDPADYGKGLDVQETGVSVTMSKDSLDDGTKADKEQSPDEDISDRRDSIKEVSLEDQNVENYEYTEPSSVSSASDHLSADDHSQRETEDSVLQKAVETFNSDTEMNTLKEMAEKREFFKNLEREDESSLDYGKLNKILDETMTGKDASRPDDVLQATGAELGNSIFNMTGIAGAIQRQAGNQDEGVPPDKGTVKPSMLSKVSLMDSLESSMGTAQRQKIKQIRKRQIDLPEEPSETEVSLVQEATRRDEDKEYSINVDSEDDHDVMKVEEKHGNGGCANVGNVFLNTSAANELAQLQQALKDAQMATAQNTGELSENIRDIGSLGDDSPPDIINTPRMTPHKPVIATNEVDSQGLSYSPSISIPGLNQVYMPPSGGAAMEQQGILIPRENQRDKPVLDQLDVFQAAQSRFTFNQGFELPEKGKESKTDRKEKSDQEENFGFSLRPAAEMHAVVTSDEETPPLESLKGIKSIAKKRRQDLTGSSNAEHEKAMAKMSAAKASAKTGKKADVVTKRGAAKTRKDGGGASGGGSREVNRFGWSSGSRTNTPLKGKRSTPVKDERRKTPKKQSNINQKATSPAQLMASVENFANYLNTFVHRGADDVTAKQRSDWSTDDANYSPTNEIAEKRLLREQALQREVERWQCMWQDERKEKEKLVDELINKDKEWKRREQTLSLEYKKEMNDLKQNIFVLETRLKDVNLESDKKKRVVKGGSLKGLTDEELQRLEKEIRDQDQLLSGYQQESERLCQVLKDTQNKNKEVEKQMFKENQKLASEVAALKERLERQEGVFGMTGAAAMGAERIHQLHTQVQVLKTNEQEMRKEIDELERERAQLRKDQKRLERERDTAVNRADHAEDSNSQVRNELASGHAADVERLNRKLKWYVENQELLDKDAATLKKKNNEIAELRDLVERLENERGQTCLEKDRKDKERAMDAKRIQDLERQVREMEQIIRRRYPNSIPALIYAASATPGEGKPVKGEDTPKKVTNAPSYAFLENRVQKLDHEMEEREEDWARSFRALEQKYNAMQLQYEAQIKELEGDLHDARDNVASHTRNTRERTSVLEKELSAARDKHDKKTAQLNEEIRQLGQELSEAKVNRPKRGKKEAKGGLAERGMVEELEERLKTLVEECSQKDRVADELRVTCSQLQRQREEMLANKEVDEISKTTQKSLLEKLDLMNVDNRQLRDQISQMSVEMDQQRVRYQGSLAEVERIARQEREASHEELRALRTQHKQELDDVRADFATQHSRSRVAEMTGKIASLEIVIERLKDKLAKSAELEAEFASKKLNEEVLKQEVVQLKTALKKAKQCHSPEMQHYAQLEEKIVAMETRHARREQDLQAMIGKLRTTADLEKDEVLSKWRGLLRRKTEETERFRVELDSILTVLDDLRRQGVVVPLQNVQNIR